MNLPLQDYLGGEGPREPGTLVVRICPQRKDCRVEEYHRDETILSEEELKPEPPSPQCG